MQVDGASGPEGRPPGRRLALETVEAQQFGCVDLAKCEGRHIVSRRGAGRAADQNREPTLPRRSRHLHRRVVQIAGSGRPSDNADRNGRRVEEVGLPELLGQRDTPFAGPEHGRGRVRGGAERHRVLAPQLRRLPTRVLLLVAEHAEIDIDCRRLRALVVDLDRHHVAVGPRNGAGGHAASLCDHEPLVDREMLMERAGHEHVLARIDEVHVDQGTAATVVRVRPPEAERRAVHRMNVHAVDLELQRERRRPDETAHPAVPHRHALFGAGSWRRVVEVGSSEVPPRVDLNQAGRRHAFPGRDDSQRKDDHDQRHTPTPHGIPSLHTWLYGRRRAEGSRFRAAASSGTGSVRRQHARPPVRKERTSGSE